MRRSNGSRKEEAIWSIRGLIECEIHTVVERKRKSQEYRNVAKSTKHENDGIIDEYNFHPLIYVRLLLFFWVDYVFIVDSKKKFRFSVERMYFVHL